MLNWHNITIFLAAVSGIATIFTSIAWANPRGTAFTKRFYISLILFLIFGSLAVGLR